MKTRQRDREVPGPDEPWSETRPCLETAVRMLQDAGYPIEDVADEIDGIQSRSFRPCSSPTPPVTTWPSATTWDCPRRIWTCAQCSSCHRTCRRPR